MLWKVSDDNDHLNGYLHQEVQCLKVDKKKKKEERKKYYYCFCFAFKRTFPPINSKITSYVHHRLSFKTAEARASLMSWWEEPACQCRSLGFDI